MKRIAMISEHASPLAYVGGHADSGGQNVYVAQVSRYLSKRGYEVDVFTRRENLFTPDVVEWLPGVRVIHVAAGPAEIIRKEELLPYMNDFTAWIVNFIAGQGTEYELIHANFWMSGLVAMNLKAQLGIPYVITFHALGVVRKLHQGSADGFPEERFEIEKRVAAEADSIIAECPQDREDLRAFYDADPERIRMIPCGFDPGEFHPVDKTEARRRLGLPASGRLLLQLGRMVPRKGVDTAIQGFAGFVKQATEPAVLVIVGGDGTDGEETNPASEIARLKRIAEEEGVRGKVLFAGGRERDELKFFYSAADLFLTLPWYEPFGITPLEAMACGTPVIGARVGGIKYSVVSGRTGWLIPPRSPEALAERLDYTFEHPRLLELFGHRALEHVEDFSWEKVASRIASLYEEVEESLFVRRSAVRLLPVNPWLNREALRARSR